MKPDLKRPSYLSPRTCRASVAFVRVDSSDAFKADWNVLYVFVPDGGSRF